MSLFSKSDHTGILGPQVRCLTARIGIWLLLAALGVALLNGCGGAGGPDVNALAEAGADDFEPPLWRYVNSGWVSPVEYLESGASPYLKELRVFVITTQEQLDEFDQGFVSKRVSGNSITLGRIDFEQSIVLAAYYVWRPVQGDPLSVVGMKVDGVSAVVELELSEDPQGHEYPYLFAPMTMVAVDRGLFPLGEPVDFVFQLNGEPGETVTAVPNGKAEAAEEECPC